MSDDAPKAKPQCPHCGNELHAELVARAAESSRMQFAITPKPGELMTADGVGGSVVALSKLMGSVGRDIGYPTVTMIEKISTSEDGTLTFHLLLVRNPKHKRSKPKAQHP